MTEPNDREAHLRHLADQLEFSMEKRGDRYRLTRTADLERTERESDLTLDEVEDVLRRWKLRGFGGG